MQGIDGSLVQIGAPYLGQMTDNLTELFPVPENTVGLVIGRGGSEIQNIQSMSGCRVQMCPDADSSGYRQVTLQGNRANIEKAKQLINDVVMRAQQRQHGGSHGQQTFDASRSITIDIQIPAGKCGLIIGKQGETIRQLQEQAGCKMLMIQDTQEVTGVPKPLRICGEPEKVEIARRLVAELLSKEEGNNGASRVGQDPASSAKGEVVVPRSSVGMIIGKGGETIKRLAMETGTKIQFKPDEDPNSAERCAVIMGTRDQIYQATELITELVNKSANNQNQTQETFFMHIPANKTGLVIGKGGETIKQINSESGAHCELSREAPPNPQEKVFIIKGTPQQIQHAQHIIKIKVGDIPPNTPVPMIGGGGGGPMMGNGNFPHQGQFNGQYGAQPVHQQWGQPMPPNVQYAQYQQTATGTVVPQPYAQPQPQPGTGQPTINPATGQPDYSAQWAEYYRNVGLMEQAAMVENQMKQNAARAQAAATGSATSTAYAAGSQYPTGVPGPVAAQPTTGAGGQQYAQYQPVGGFPPTSQFQGQGQPQPF
ncbi:unnamed protein product [Caenorhabditis bovis]|uniref:K Homology domain-containing protein n=1 Tax=Caenorhabditis bovis TaxID=2654633 RepID=A0A8S1E8X3_9PELO|nr:unnamed protein product [Caenorhabditis bovis]